MSSWKLSTTGKLFLAGLAAWIVARPTRLKIRGTPEEVKALSEALSSSKVFQDELRKPGATVDSVIEKLGLMHARGKKFESILGIPWPFS
ncbi:MAG: hypothetical protein AABW56_01455 [Nanoarchaeota archaeon]